MDLSWYNKQKQINENVESNINHNNKKNLVIETPTN